MKIDRTCQTILLSAIKTRMQGKTVGSGVVRDPTRQNFRLVSIEMTLYKESFESALA